MVNMHDPKFWDAADLAREIRRVFDICHTCRMCFSYCPSFPALFDAVDRHEEKGEGEVEALTPEEITPVVDLCWQCKLCYVKCPYTPPHKFMVDFPRLLQRAKLVQVRRDGVKLRERVLGDPDRLGRMSVGLAAGMTNWANTRPLIRRGLEKLLGIHHRRRLPTFAKNTFRKWFRGHGNGRTAAEEHGQKVALFATCSVEYNEPQIGVAAVQVLEHNRVGVELPNVVCCGLPALDGGDLETATKKIEHNVRALLPLVKQGLPIVVLGPSCGLMMKSEWPQIVPTDDCRAVSAAVMDIGEYLAKQKAAGRLDTTFPVSQGKIAYHVPCHLRAQNIGQPFRALLEGVPGTKVEPIEQCSAFDGTWGMKTEYYETSRKCAGKLCNAIGRSGADRVISDCTLAGLNVVEEMGIKPSHPIEALRDAYGLSSRRVD
ncbi:MAG: heterodisulfide reductase-related iron-sulfur binding cluster [Thermoanaerobaculia bacterium]